MLRSLPKMFREPSAVHPEHDDAVDDDETRPENRLPPPHHDGPRPSVNLRRSGTTVVKARQRNELIDAIVAAFVAPSAPHADVARAFGELRKVLWRSVIEWKTRVDPISHQQARAVRGGLAATPRGLAVLLANARDAVCDDVPDRRGIAGLLLLSAVAGEPACLVGPPGCGQRVLVKRLGRALYGPSFGFSPVNATEGGSTRVRLAVTSAAMHAEGEGGGELEEAAAAKSTVMLVDGTLTERHEGGVRGGDNNLGDDGIGDAARAISAGVGRRYGEDALVRFTVVGCALDAEEAAEQVEGSADREEDEDEDAVLLRIPIGPLPDAAFQHALVKADAGGEGDEATMGDMERGVASLDIPLGVALVGDVRRAARDVSVPADVAAILRDFLAWFRLGRGVSPGRVARVERLLRVSAACDGRGALTAGDLLLLPLAVTRDARSRRRCRAWLVARGCGDPGSDGEGSGEGGLEVVSKQGAEAAREAAATVTKLRAELRDIAADAERRIAAEEASTSASTSPAASAAASAADRSAAEATREAALAVLSAGGVVRLRLLPDTSDADTGVRNGRPSPRPDVGILHAQPPPIDGASSVARVSWLVAGVTEDVPWQRVEVLHLADDAPVKELSPVKASGGGRRPGSRSASPADHDVPALPSIADTPGSSTSSDRSVSRSRSAPVRGWSSTTAAAAADAARALMLGGGGELLERVEALEEATIDAEEVLAEARRSAAVESPRDTWGTAGTPPLWLLPAVTREARAEAFIEEVGAAALEAASMASVASEARRVQTRLLEAAASRAEQDVTRRGLWAWAATWALAAASSIEKGAGSKVSGAFALTGKSAAADELAAAQAGALVDMLRISGVAKRVEALWQREEAEGVSSAAEGVAALYFRLVSVSDALHRMFPSDLHDGRYRGLQTALRVPPLRVPAVPLPRLRQRTETRRRPKSRAGANNPTRSPLSTPTPSTQSQKSPNHLSDTPGEVPGYGSVPNASPPYVDEGDGAVSPVASSPSPVVATMTAASSTGGSGGDDAPIDETHAGDLITYEYDVYTSDLENAGTSAVATIEVWGSMYGAHTSVGPIPINEPEGVVRHIPRCSKTSGVIHSRDLGELRSVRISQDGGGISPSWHCALVVIRDTSVNLTSYFYCDRWLDGMCDRSTILKPSWRTPLPGGMCRYIVTVKTSDVMYAGTDANVHFELCGKKDVAQRQLASGGSGASSGSGGGWASGSFGRLSGRGSRRGRDLFTTETVTTRRINLKNSRNNFERKQEDFFIVDALDVGHMSHIVIGHDGRNFGAGWHLAEVRVENTSTEATGLAQYAVFKSGKWFDRKEPPRQLEQTIYAQGSSESAEDGPDAQMPLGWGKQVTYTLLLYTTSYRGASVFVELEGEKGSLPMTQMVLTGRQAHEKGGVDVFTMIGSDVGAITSMGMMHSYGKPWKFIYAEAINDSTGIPTPFFCFGWMGQGGTGKFKELPTRRLRAFGGDITEPPRADDSSSLLPPERTAGDTLAPGRCRYKVAVYTTNRWWAGTDANITLQLRGSLGEVDRKLKHDAESMWTDKFERGQVDTFFFEDDDVAALDPATGEWLVDQMTLRSDGRGAGADWHVDHVRVMCVTRAATELIFDCRNWFSRGHLTCRWRRGDLPFPHDVGYPKAADARPLAFCRVPGTWGAHRYKVIFSTSLGWWSGTKSRVGITLHGDVGDCTPVLDQRRDHFKAGQSDTFYFATDTSVGELDTVEVLYAGGDRWRLDKVQVTDLSTGREWLFLCTDVIQRPGLELTDKHLMKRGNIVADECDYEFTFYTDDVSGGGTDAGVYCEVMGRYGVSEAQAFDREGALFERGSVDAFLRALDRDLGELLTLRVWHDGAGWGSAWALTKVEVKNVRSQRTWLFPNYGKWVRNGKPVTLRGRVIVEGAIERKGGRLAGGQSAMLGGRVASIAPAVQLDAAPAGDGEDGGKAPDREEGGAPVQASDPEERQGEIA